MESLIRDFGGRFVELDIKNYKSKVGNKADFSDRPNFRAELLNTDPTRTYFYNTFSGTKKYVAVYWKNHVVIDVDWKDAYRPSTEQKNILKYLRERFHSYPSMTKKHGMHILVPKADFANLPKGNPKLYSLCTGTNVVEVLTDKPVIIRSKLFISYQRTSISMAPTQIDYLNFSPDAKGPSNRAVGLTKVIDVEPKPPMSIIEQCDSVRDYRRYLEMLSPARCDDRDNWLRMARLGWSLNDYEGWDNWSKKSEKYNREGNLRTWDSITSSLISMGTLVNWAREDSPGLMYPYQQGKVAIEEQGFAFLGRTKD